METRTFVWICVTQFLVAVLGFITLGIVLKLHGWPEQTFYQFYPLTVALRNHGPWLLLVPVAWLAFAFAARHFERGLLTPDFANLVGCLLVVLIAGAFLIAIAKPGRRPLLMHVPTSSRLP